MTDSSTDDSFHSGARPQEHLKGSSAGVHTQSPATSETQANPRSASADNVNQSWDSTSLGSAPKGVGNNDKNQAR